MKNFYVSIALCTTMVIISSDQKMGRPRSDAIARVKLTDTHLKPSTVDHPVGNHFKRSRPKVTPPPVSHNNRSQSTPQATKLPTSNT